MKMESCLSMKNIFKIDNSTYVLMLLGLLSGYIKNIFVLLVIVLIHELGHVFFFYVFNYDIESVVIYPFGGVSKVNKRIHERIYKDVLVSLGGIIFQLLLFLIFYLFYINNLIVMSTYNMFCRYNIKIIFFNMLPMIPLDGSKLFFALCTKYLSFKNSYILMIGVGLLSLILFVFSNIIFGLNDMVIYIFLLLNLLKIVKDYKYFMNRFYLERILYNNYYDAILYNGEIDKMKLNKYYYFLEDGRYINEGKYLIEKWR